METKEDVNTAKVKNKIKSNPLRWVSCIICHVITDSNGFSQPLEISVCAKKQNEQTIVTQSLTNYCDGTQKVLVQNVESTYKYTISFTDRSGSEVARLEATTPAGSNQKVLQTLSSCL